MPELFAQADIDAPVDRVWSLLADFGNIQAWWPRDGGPISSCSTIWRPAASPRPWRG